MKPGNGAALARSILDQLLFSIGLAISRSRDLLHRLTGETSHQVASRVVEHVEQ